MDDIRIGGPALTALIKPLGAELCSLVDGQGREVMWQGAQPWPRHAPNLFPIIGRLRDDRLVVDGRDYRVTQHGFARDNLFALTSRSAESCRLVLADSPATRAIFPFAFRFEVAYAIAGDTLSITFRVMNPGGDTLPASMGAHPAFQWPLPGAAGKSGHTLDFDAEETAPIRRVAGGLLMADTFPNPIAGRHLDLDLSLFAQDAIILERPASRSVRYTAPGAPVVEVSWDSGFPSLGIWSRPDADLLCIEPWHGMSSPAGFDGEFRDKPGIMLIPPGEARSATHRIRVA